MSEPPGPPAADSKRSEGTAQGLLQATPGRAEAAEGPFEGRYRALREDVLRLCRRMLDSREDAEDAAHEVYLRAQQGFAHYDPHRPFRPWLLSIAAHHCVDRLRRRHTNRALFDASELSPESVPDHGPGPLGSVLAYERRGELLTALDAMPARFRAVLALRYFADQSYREIAEALDVSEDHVGVLIHRAKARLREALGRKGERR